MPQILLRLKYINLWLYEPKLQLKSHIIELQYAKVFLLSMTTYLWMLKSRRCCNGLFVKQSKLVLLISANDLFYERVLLNILNLMGSPPWRPMLNLCFQNWLFFKSWPLVRNLLMQVTFDNLGRNGLGHLGVQSQHILVLQIFTRSLMKHTMSFLKTCSYIFIKGTCPFPLMKIFGCKGWFYTNANMLFFLVELLWWKMCCLQWFQKPCNYMCYSGLLKKKLYLLVLNFGCQEATTLLQNVGAIQ
jgi:hypothetical protein